MRRAIARRVPSFDHLESRQLLATGTGTIPPAALTYTHNFLPAAEAQLLQTDASGKNLEVFMARLAQLTSTRPEIQRFASQVILDDMAAELQGSLLAKNKDVVLPPDLIGQDVTIARQVLAALNATNIDQLFLTNMVQINTTAIATGNQIVATSTDTDVRNFAQAGVALDQTHLTAAQNLLGGTSSGIGNGTAPTPTNPVTVNATDTAFLQTAHSANNTEIFTSQIAQLLSTNVDVQQYGQKLVFDHTLAETTILQLANANGVSLSPTLSPSEASSVRSLLTTLIAGGATGAASYEQAYLAEQVPMHRMVMQADSQEAATTPNPNLREYARSDVATAAMHILAAQRILNTRPNALLPPGITSENLHVRVRRVNRFSFILDARLRAGGFRYNSTMQVRFPRNLPGTALPNPTRAQIRDALFNSLNSFLNEISTPSTSATALRSVRGRGARG